MHAASCIGKPNALAPEGEHWYYRTDRALGRQCWYLGPEDNNERGATRQASARTAPDAPVQSVAPQPAQPPAATETNFSTATDPPSSPGATKLPFMPPLFQPEPTPAPAEQPQTNDAIDPPPEPARDADSEPELPPIAQSSPVPAPLQSTEEADHTLAFAVIAFLTIVIFGSVLEAMRWLRRRKSSNRRTPDWDALYQSAQASPGVNSTKPPRHIPQPPVSFVPPPPRSFADAEKLAEDLQKILDELRTRTSFSLYESGDLTRSG